MARVFKIVLTGGPCGGKTAAHEALIKEFCDYAVFFCPESATLLLNGGLTRDILGDRFQECISQNQASNETLFTRYAQYAGRDALLFFDRGIPDGRAYLTEEQFAALLRQLNLTKQTLYARYDAVFHLVTAAFGAENDYRQNGLLRDETPSQARALDLRCREVYAPHPYHRVIENTGAFSEKMQMLCAEVHRFLAQTKPE